MAESSLLGFEPEHLRRLMDCTPALFQSRGSSLKLLLFPTGTPRDRRQTASSALQTDTRVRAGLSVPTLSHHRSLLLLISRMGATRLDPAP